MDNYGGYGGAARDLGFGGSQLQSQVTDETEEQRKKRMLQQQQSGMTGQAASYQSLASFDLGLGGGIGGR